MRRFFTYLLLVAGSLVGGAIAAEAYLAYHAPPRANLPFYNVLYPYEMFRPPENATYESNETFAMSHFKSRAFVYTNEDGFRVPSAHYEIPKTKPAGQLRVAVLGGSLVQVASTYDVSLPGSLRTLLRQRYPGRDIEVINAGIQSCVSRQSLTELLFSVVDYHPDVVMLYDGGNDLGMPLVYDSRPNFPYNFQSMQEAWDLYRDERTQPLWRVALGRSNLYRLIRARLHPDDRNMAANPDTPYIGTKAIPATRILSDHAYVHDHVAAYLSNWQKLVELSTAYHYQPILILSATGQREDDGTTAIAMKNWKLDRQTARDWLHALTEMYDEASKQICDLQKQYPDARFLDLSRFLDPPDKYFSDSDHVYDEVNMLLAQRIYDDARPLIETQLSKVQREGR
jgi:hypothetical protein